MKWIWVLLILTIAHSLTAQSKVVRSCIYSIEESKPVFGVSIESHSMVVLSDESGCFEIDFEMVLHLKLYL